MYGVWWAGAEPDVKDVGDGAKGYNALALQHGAEPNAKVVKDILSHGARQGPGHRAEGRGRPVLYMRGLIGGDAGRRRRARARRSASARARSMTGEQARWGYENLALDQKKLDALGFAGVMRPVSTSCADHMGAAWARMHTWDGAKWNFTLRLVPGRRADHQADGEGGGRQVRRREEADAAHAGGLPELTQPPERLAPLPLEGARASGPAKPVPRRPLRSSRGHA